MTTYSREKYERYKKPCIECGVLIKYQATRCRDCYQRSRQLRAAQVTVAQIKAKHKHRWRDIIRQYAHSALDTKEQACVSCGYDKHVERAHIKDIASFSDDATIQEINELSNLVLLCPNCHWEYDNGLLEL